MYLEHPTISIMGDYWDSYMYKHQLFLWSMSGELIIVDWRKIDVEILSDATIIKEKDLERYIIAKYENPFTNRQTDVDFLDNKMYGITDKGLFKININMDKGIKPNNDSKLWDEKLLSIKANKNGRIALSAGQEGLYEYDVNKLYAKTNRKQFESIEKRNIFRISKDPSNFSYWMFSSIYSSAIKEKSYMAGFKWNNSKLDFQTTIFQDNIFKDEKTKRFSWGAGNKIYRVVDSGLEYVEFIQSKINNPNNISPFSEIKRIQFQQWKGKPLYAGVARFGAIVECDNALVIMFNNGEHYNIHDLVAKWRVFTSDEFYSNQLHTILDDRIKIYSFDIEKLKGNESNKRFDDKYLWS